jgi:hypothetical protein
MEKRCGTCAMCIYFPPEEGVVNSGLCVQASIFNQYLPEWIGTYPEQGKMVDKEYEGRKCQTWQPIPSNQKGETK